MSFNNSNSFLSKRIPSVLGVLFLVMSLGTISWLSGNAILFGTKAALGDNPKNIQVSNISDKSFTVSYQTDEQSIGTVSYGTDENLGQVALDERDQKTKTPTPHAVHSITITGLNAGTKYFFSITSGDQTYKNDGIPYEVTTATSSITSPGTSTLKGKIALDNGAPPVEAIVFASADDTQLLSSLVTSSGNYQINLSNMRTKNLSSAANLLGNNILRLQVFDATRKSDVSLLVKQAGNVPLVILSKNYNFAVNNEPLAPSPLASDSAEIDFPINEEATGTKPGITSPQDDQGFNDQQPLFKGTAVPNAEVEITIESEHTITATVKASSNGNWQYRPTEKLEPGEHTITIKTKDASGIIKTIKQSFTVYAEGSQFTEPSVSPSTSPTTNPSTTPTNTPTPTRTPTTAPSTTVTVTKTPTPTKTSTPTPTPTNTITPTPSIKEPIPVTGNTTLMIIVIGVISTISIGTLLFFLAMV